MNEPRTLTRAEFVAAFSPPHSLSAAYRFGLSEGAAGRGRLTFTEFFANDHRLLVGLSRPDIYESYKRGIEHGRERRKLNG